MTPKEALDILDKTVIRNLELKIVLSEAIKKQIPKKPKYYPLSDGQCPSCNAIFDYDWKPKSKYCQNCGQAIDWSDTEC